MSSPRLRHGSHTSRDESQQVRDFENGALYGDPSSFLRRWLRSVASRRCCDRNIVVASWKRKEDELSSPAHACS